MTVVKIKKGQDPDDFHEYDILDISEYYHSSRIDKRTYRFAQHPVYRDNGIKEFRTDPRLLIRIFLLNLLYPINSANCTVKIH